MQMGRKKKAKKKSQNIANVLNELETSSLCIGTLTKFI